MSTGRDSIRWTDRCEGEEWDAVFNLGLGEEDMSTLDATLEGSKDDDAASLEEEEDTGDEISTLWSN